LPPTSAFVDTSVLTDVLLKPGASRAQAVAALSKFDETLLPVYAIKEFRAGPLRYFAWTHNVLVNEKSFSRAMFRVHAVSRTPQRYLNSTSIEAIAIATQAALGTKTTAEVQAQYGPNVTMDNVAADELRIALRSLIWKAWRKRRRVTSRIVNPLSCYGEPDPVEENGLIVVGDGRCTLEPSCALAPEFRKRIGDTRALRDAVQAQGEGREHQRRYQALRELARTNRSLDNSKCRSLGDAVFVFLAPAGSVILTTNINDHQPLAQALGKSAASPSDVLEPQ
jgi:hypothetical protein